AVIAAMMFVAVAGKRFIPPPSPLCRAKSRHVPRLCSGRTDRRRARSDELDLLDLVVTVARRGRDFDVLAHLSPNEGPPERRIVTDASDARVGFGLPDELVPNLLLV